MKITKKVLNRWHHLLTSRGVEAETQIIREASSYIAGLSVKTYNTHRTLLYGYGVEDAIQDGHIAFLKALRRFDPDKGNLSYFYQYITFEIKLMCAKHSTPVKHPPKEMYEYWKTLAEARSNGGDPDGVKGRTPHIRVGAELTDSIPQLEQNIVFEHEWEELYQLVESCTSPLKVLGFYGLFTYCGRPSVTDLTRFRKHCEKYLTKLEKEAENG